MTKGDAVAKSYEDGSPIDMWVFTFLLVAALVVLIARSGRVGLLLRKNGLILLYFSFCAVSIVWSDYPFVALKRWVKALGDLGIVLIILTESDPLGALKRVVTRVGFLIFPLSVLFIACYPGVGRILTQSWTLEPTGVATQKNALGLDCMVYGVFFLWMMLSVYRERQDPSRHRRLLAHGMIVIMIIWLLGQCQSMTSITGLVAAGGVMWLASRRSRGPVVVHASVIVVLGIAITALFFDPGGSMIGALGKDPTIHGRTEIWRLVLGLHTNPLVGTGFESFWLGPRLKQMWTAMPNFYMNEAHNGYLELYLNLGWAGICFIALLLATGYKRVVSGIRRNPGRASLFLGFFLCTLFYAFSEAAFRTLTISWVFLLLVIVGGSQAALFRCTRPTRLAYKTNTSEEPATESALSPVTYRTAR
ncbi:MAG: O-antigen ligase family protein [Terriglobia bacterium]|jgi:O-antigen ligase|nr:O-antigen ligase family protein [Terriglobia bacterium]